jgi:small subunit ribosomal protein S18
LKRKKTKRKKTKRKGARRKTRKKTRKKKRRNKMTEQEKKKKRTQSRKKYCPFCTEKNLVLDYKNPAGFKRFLTERGKIVPRRISGACAKHQRQLALAVKRARHIALVPYTVTGRGTV